MWASSDGTYSKGNFNPLHAISGTANYGLYAPGGTAGTLVMNVPLADIGSPPSGSPLTNTFADTHRALTVDGQGLYYTAAPTGRRTSTTARHGRLETPADRYFAD